MDIPQQEMIAGRNAVMEALRSGHIPDTIYIAEGELHGSIGKLKALAHEKGVVVKTVSRKKLDALSPEVNHQGVVASCACADYATIEELLEVSRQKGTAPFLIVADEIADPHNLGAILRTAEAAGADGVIIPKRRSASLTAAVYKTSAGAASMVKVARVPNLAACIRRLKEEGIWIYGADMEGERFDRVDLRGAAAIVIGSEGRGLSRIVRESCDFLITLPMKGQINSLNASVAAGVLMYEVVRQRL